MMYLYSDMHLVLQNDMLTKVDLMSMANSLEVVFHFLTMSLLIMFLPYLQNIKWIDIQERKYLKDAFQIMIFLKKYITDAKHGFEVPLLKWFRSELKSMIFR